MYYMNLKQLFNFSLLLFCSVFFLPSWLLITASSGFLDLEELKTSFYSVRISDTPLLETDTFDSEEEAVRVSSKFGQRYVCHYRRTPTGEPVESEEKIAELNITDILEPMRGNCLIKTKDWWTYEFCYGQEITQFHLANGKKSGDIITIGRYESDKTWLPEDLAKLKKSTVNRYHTQSYVNGSICDLTNNPRYAEVRFSCVEGEVDRIGAVGEMESCSYILFVYTSKICHHPYLRPPTQAKASAIECQPIVTQSAYDRYIAQLQAEKLKESKINAEDVSPTQSEPEDTQVNLLDSFLKSLMKDEEEEAEDSEPLPAATLTEKIEAEKIKLLELLAEMMKEGNGKNTVYKYKETIKKYITSQFDEIIAEAKAELDEEEDEDSDDITHLKKVMSSVLESQLNSLQELEQISELNQESGSDPDAADVGEETESKEQTQQLDKSTEQENPLKAKIAKPLNELKIEYIQPTQLEVEMIDVDDIDESSEYYNTARQAQKQQAKSENKQIKTVIAVLRPMQEKGTRQEEKKHQRLQENYGRRWDEPHNEL